jgi:hypothetical protein
MSYVYYVDESYIRENLPIDYSLLSGNIKPALNQAHLINVVDMLGDRMFDEMNRLITTGDINQPQYANWKKLLDHYLQNVVVYWTGVYLTNNLLAKYANRGIQQENSEFSNPPDLALWRTLKNQMEDLATYYSQKANDWLYWNQNFFVPFYTYMISNGLTPANPREKMRAGGLVLGQRPWFSYNNMCFVGGYAPGYAGLGSYGGQGF